MKYKNPIIKGMHPDPSICRVGEDYYLVNSSFEYFPGIPIFHSKDLIHWEQIGHCITRNSQLKLVKGFPNCTGIYAPTIRYSNGVFYVVTTNVAYGREDEGNFFIWTKDPYGEWSDPIFLDMPGIDPSLFFDENGKVYYMGTYGEIYLCEIDIHSGKSIGERKNIWTGTGGNDPEGPHIYHINDWYYLFISEGGTEFGHMLTTARSKNIWGPYEPCPNNPVLTNRSTSRPIKSVGHADLVKDQRGNWWAVCLGVRSIGYPFKHNLGRETMLVKVEWTKEGWPIIGNDGFVDVEMEADCLPEVLVEKKPARDCFLSPELDYVWNYLYNPIDGLVKLEQKQGGVLLYGNEHGLSEKESLAWLGRRQEEHVCTVRTKLRFDPKKDKEEAGLTIYMNNAHHYEAALSKVDGKTVILLRRTIGSLYKIEQMIPYEKEEVILELIANEEFYTFGYGETEESIKVLGQGETAYLTTEVGGKFTGNYIAMYATGNGSPCENPAHFSWFELRNKE